MCCTHVWHVAFGFAGLSKNHQSVPPRAARALEKRQPRNGISMGPNMTCSFGQPSSDFSEIGTALRERGELTSGKSSFAHEDPLSMLVNIGFVQVANFALVMAELWLGSLL